MFLYCLAPAGLNNTFSSFGPLTVEWPGKDGKHPRCPPKGNMPKGNAAVGYLISLEHLGGGGGHLEWAWWCGTVLVG